MKVTQHKKGSSGRAMHLDNSPPSSSFSAASPVSRTLLGLPNREPAQANDAMTTMSMREELQTMPREQLTQLIVNARSMRKESHLLYDVIRCPGSETSDDIMRLQIALAFNMGIPQTQNATMEQIRFIFLTLGSDLLPDKFKRSTMSNLSDRDMRELYGKHRQALEAQVTRISAVNAYQSSIPPPSKFHEILSKQIRSSASKRSKKKTTPKKRAGRNSASKTTLQIAREDENHL